MPTRRQRLVSLSIAALAPASAPAGFTSTYQGSQADNTAQSTYTFPAFAIGGASADRVVCAIIWTRSGSAHTITVTIGGVAATAIVNMAAGEARGLSAWYASVPSGTTADVVVTPSISLDRCAAAVYTISGTTQSTYAARSGANPNSSASAGSLATTAITVPTGGIGIAAAWIGAASSAVTWTQTSGSGTEDLDALLGTTMWGSTYQSPTTGSQAYTATGAAAVQYRVLSFAWGP